MLYEHERYYGLGMDALVSICPRNTNVIRTRTLLWFGHACTGKRMLLEHKRYYCWGIDALVGVCFRNTDVIIV